MSTVPRRARGVKQAAIQERWKEIVRLIGRRATAFSIVGWLAILLAAPTFGSNNAPAILRFRVDDGSRDLIYCLSGQEKRPPIAAVGALVLLNARDPRINEFTSPDASSPQVGCLHYGWKGSDNRNCYDDESAMCRDTSEGQLVLHGRIGEISVAPGTHTITAVLGVLSHTTWIAAADFLGDTPCAGTCSFSASTTFTAAPGEVYEVTVGARVVETDILRVDRPLVIRIDKK